jgi:hypothetical protein
MPTREELIAGIVDAEWILFDLVENEGGRASCQDDEQTFRIMRGSQFSGWDEQMLESYFEDLLVAASEGRNLLEEKYAYMMESTDPEIFAEMKDQLPAISDGKRVLIEQIVATSLKWQDETFQKYPKIASRGRTMTSDTDGTYNASFETYLRGELSTYSEQTLTAYALHTQELLARGENLDLIILDATMRQYGFASIDEAEATLK